MAVKIRLRRMGTKKAPFYRVVVADSRNARGGKAIEEIGFYNPISIPKEINIDAEKATEWLNKGAQPTEVVARLFDKAGIKK
jgi:small subunit ribosomal protein S16